MRKLKLDELNRLSTTDFKLAEKNKITLVLDNIRSAMNVGSFFRTADAFLIDEIILVGITAQPPNREILKTALGATETVSWQYFENIEDCISYLKQRNKIMISIEQSDSSVLLNQFKPKESEEYALIFGNEVDGVSTTFMENCAFCLEIPQFGTKHSLNVSVCAGIVVWHFLQIE
jgi:23S rRNA (guanosine2251-2'-O)-methyltransferase